MVNGDVLVAHGRLQRFRRRSQLGIVIHAAEVRPGIHERKGIGGKARPRADIDDAEVIIAAGIEQALVRNEATEQGDQRKIAQRSRRPGLEVVVAVGQWRGLKFGPSWRIFRQNKNFRSRTKGLAGWHCPPPRAYFRSPRQYPDRRRCTWSSGRSAPAPAAARRLPWSRGWRRWRRPGARARRRRRWG